MRREWKGEEAKDIYRRSRQSLVSVSPGGRSETFVFRFFFKSTSSSQLYCLYRSLSAAIAPLPSSSSSLLPARRLSYCLPAGQRGG